MPQSEICLYARWEGSHRGYSLREDLGYKEHKQQFPHSDVKTPRKFCFHYLQYLSEFQWSFTRDI